MAMCGDLRSTQRSEAINSVLADRIKRNSTLLNVSKLPQRPPLQTSPSCHADVISRGSCQLFHSLNEYADSCRDKWDRRPVSSMATSTTTSMAIEESIRQLRLPAYNFNKLVHELDRSRVYAFKEVPNSLDGGGDQCDERVRCFQVGGGGGMVASWPLYRVRCWGWCVM